MNIVEELTEFAIAEPATAWWIPGGEWNRYEYLYNKTPLAEVAQAHTPMTLKTRERRAHRHSRSRAGRLLGDVAATRVGTAPQGRVVAIVERARRCGARRRS